MLHRATLHTAYLPPGLARQTDEDDDVGINPAAIAATAAVEGQEALAGKGGPVSDSLVSAAALCLWYLGRYEELPTAADAMHAVLENGAASERLARAS